MKKLLEVSCLYLAPALPLAMIYPLKSNTIIEIFFKKGEVTQFLG